MERLEQVPGLDESVLARLRFLVLSHGLTSVARVNRLFDGSRQETSAEHSWHLCICAMVLAPEVAPGVDLARVLPMLAVHDLVEIEVGDVPLYDGAARAEIGALERAAAFKLFDGVPDGSSLLALWEEFEAAATDEARFARAVDRLQPMLLHWAGGGTVWRERKVRRETLDGFVALIEGFWSPLAPTAAAIVADAARRGDFVG